MDLGDVQRLFAHFTSDPIPFPPFRLSTTACLAPRFSSNAKAAALNLEEAQVPWTPGRQLWVSKPPDFQYMENHGWNQCWNPGHLSHGKLAQQYRPARQLWPHFRPKCWWEMPALSSDLRNGLRAMNGALTNCPVESSTEPNPHAWMDPHAPYISDEKSHVFWTENLKKTPTVDG